MRSIFLLFFVYLYKLYRRYTEARNFRAAFGGKPPPPDCYYSIQIRVYYTVGRAIFSQFSQFFRARITARRYRIFPGLVTINEKKKTPPFSAS